VRVVGFAVLDESYNWDTKPNVVVKWLGLLIRIWEISGLISARRPVILIESFSVVLLSSSRQLSQNRDRAKRWVVRSVQLELISELALPDYVDFKIYFGSLTFQRNLNTYLYPVTASVV
jgi:hypothetical protein